jgi:hypothetical protein
MGEHGFGFLYVDESLIGSRIKQTLFDGHPDYNYPPWTQEPEVGAPDFVNHRSRGLDCGTPSVITYAAQCESFKYIEKIGIPNIRNHVRPLVPGRPAAEGSASARVYLYYAAHGGSHYYIHLA